MNIKDGDREPSGRWKNGDAAHSYMQQRRLCLDHAGDLATAAERVLADDQAFPNIAYHLAILAMEEIGKVGMLASLAVAGKVLNRQWLERHLSDHVFKLMWAVWSPSISGGKLDPKDFEEARTFTDSVHARRKAGLYVDIAADNSSAPPRSAVPINHATSLLAFAKARLALELEREPQTPGVGSEELEWYLATVTDELGRQRLFSRPFIQKHEEFGGDTRAWVRWTRGEFGNIAAEEQRRLEQGLARQPSEADKGKPKWLMKVRLHTPSHSLRQKS